MAIEPHRDIHQAFIEGTPIDEALNQAVREAVQLHKRMGLPMAIWRDGKVVWITAEEAEREQEASH
jgi:hypothetical protein